MRAAQLCFSFKDFAQLERQEVGAVPYDMEGLKNSLDISPTYPELWQCEWEDLKPRSTKKCIEGLEISFELTFMKEHLETLLRQAQNFIEAQNLKKSDHFSASPFVEASSFSDLQRKLRDTLSVSQWNQFLADLKCEQKLCEFLRLICNLFRSNFSLELLQIAHETWLLYLEIAQKKLTEEDLINYGELFCNRLMNSPAKFLGNKLIRVQSKSSELQNEEEREKVESFLRYFITSVLFVTQEYFTNPYFKEADESCCSLDEWESEGQEESPQGRKLLKIE